MCLSISQTFLKVFSLSLAFSSFMMLWGMGVFDFAVVCLFNLGFERLLDFVTSYFLICFGRFEIIPLNMLPTQILPSPLISFQLFICETSYCTFYIFYPLFSVLLLLSSCDLFLDIFLWSAFYLTISLFIYVSLWLNLYTEFLILMAAFFSPNISFLKQFLVLRQNSKFFFYLL